MNDTVRCSVGEWVEVERVLLEPADRSANLPEDTAAQPLLTWVKGFAQADASLRHEVTVETMTGRAVTGKLSAVNPGYFHTFGQPIPELVHVGAELRKRLAEWRAAEGGGADAGAGGGERASAGGVADAGAGDAGAGAGGSNG